MGKVVGYINEDGNFVDKKEYEEEQAENDRRPVDDTDNTNDETVASSNVNASSEDEKTDVRSKVEETFEKYKDEYNNLTEKEKEEVKQHVAEEIEMHMDAESKNGNP